MEDNSEIVETNGASSKKNELENLMLSGPTNPLLT